MAPHDEGLARKPQCGCATQHIHLGLVGSFPRVDAPVLAIAALLLAGGLAYARSTVPGARPVRALGGELRLTLPAAWVGSEHDGVYTARRASIEALGPSIEVRAVAPPPREAAAEAGDEDFLFAASAPSGAHDAALAVENELARMEDERRQSGAGYRVLQSEEKRAFGGHRSTWSHFAIVRDPPGTRPGVAIVPLVVRGVDVLVPRRDGGCWRVSAEAPAEPGGALDEGVTRTLEGLRLGR
jgi:hypothetical protein